MSYLVFMCSQNWCLLKNFHYGDCFEIASQKSGENFQGKFLKTSTLKKNNVLELMCILFSEQVIHLSVKLQILQIRQVYLNTL